MKKKLLFTTLFVLTLFPNLELSAQQKNALPKPKTLTTQSDSISYALGVSLMEGMPAYLQRLEVLVDTAMVAYSHNHQIANETDAVRKKELEKKFKHAMDSINAANKKNIERFKAGLLITLQDKDSDPGYDAGLSIGAQMKPVLERAATELLAGDSKSIDMDVFLAAFFGRLNNEKGLMEFNDAQALLTKKSTAMQATQREREEEQLKAGYAEWIAEQEAFQEENKKNPEVVTMPSGLQYKVLKAGTGEKPNMGDAVEVSYRGSMINGTVFDDSSKRPGPTVFAVGQLVKGFNEALMLMPEGSKWTIYIPSELGYGASERGEVKPFSTLVFDLELINIQK